MWLSLKSLIRKLTALAVVIRMVALEKTDCMSNEIWCPAHLFYRCFYGWQKGTSPVWLLSASVIFDFHTTFWWLTCSKNLVSRPKTFLPHENYQFGYQSTAFLIFIHSSFPTHLQDTPTWFGIIRVVTLTSTSYSLCFSGWNFSIQKLSPTMSTNCTVQLRVVFVFLCLLTKSSTGC